MSCNLLTSKFWSEEIRAAGIRAEVLNPERSISGAIAHRNTVGTPSAC